MGDGSECSQLARILLHAGYPPNETLPNTCGTILVAGGDKGGSSAQHLDRHCNTLSRVCDGGHIPKFGKGTYGAMLEEGEGESSEVNVKCDPAKTA